MNWQDLGGALAKAGAPIIGRALGGPLGGMIGDAIGGVLADALGVESNPDAVDKAIKATSHDELQAKLSAAETEAQAKWPAFAEIAKRMPSRRPRRSPRPTSRCAPRRFPATPCSAGGGRSTPSN